MQLESGVNNRTSYSIEITRITKTHWMCPKTLRHIVHLKCRRKFGAVSQYVPLCENYS